MPPENYGQPAPPSGTWTSTPPPAPEGTWPPPPTLAPGVTVPFKTVFAYVEGSVPLFRVGTLSFGGQGLLIQGKVVPRYEIQVPIVAVCFLLRVGWIIAYLIMEYAARSDAALDVPWDQVRRIILVPRKRQACVVYQAPNYKGVVKPFSLTTKLEPAAYDAYAAAANQYAPGRVGEGKLRAWTSPVVWTVCIGILLAVLLLAIFFAVSNAHTGAVPSQ